MIIRVYVFLVKQTKPESRSSHQWIGMHMGSLACSIDALEYFFRRDIGGVSTLFFCNYTSYSDEFGQLLHPLAFLIFKDMWMDVPILPRRPSEKKNVIPLPSLQSRFTRTRTYVGTIPLKQWSHDVSRPYWLIQG